MINERSTAARRKAVCSLATHLGVWVDGKMQREYGKPSPNVINGVNIATRVLLAESVRPGQTIQVAVYGINGILSAPSSTRIFIREARVDFVR